MKKVEQSIPQQSEEKRNSKESNSEEKNDSRFDSKREHLQKGVSKEWIFRMMKMEDLDEVVNIEKSSFRFPLERREFENMIEKSEKDPENCHYFPYVLEIEGEGVGGFVCGETKTEFIFWEKEKEEEEGEEGDDEEDEDEDFADDHDCEVEKITFAHGLSLATNPKFRKTGIGKYLMKEILKIGIGLKYSEIIPVLFKRKYGFQNTKRLEDYYARSTSGEGKNMKLGDHEGDAVEMRLYLDHEFEKKYKMNEEVKLKNQRIIEGKEKKIEEEQAKISQDLYLLFLGLGDENDKDKGN